MALTSETFWTAKIDGIQGTSKIVGAEGHVNLTAFQQTDDKPSDGGNIGNRYFQLVIVRNDRTSNSDDAAALRSFAENNKSGYVIDNFNVYQHQFVGNNELKVVNKWEMQGVEVENYPTPDQDTEVFIVKARKGIRTPFTISDKGVVAPGHPSSWDYETYQTSGA